MALNIGSAINFVAEIAKGKETNGMNLLKWLLCNEIFAIKITWTFFCPKTAIF